MSHKGLLQFRMSEFSGAASSGAVILEEPEGPGGPAGHGEDQEQEQGPLRCGGCTLWPRQQTWLCVVPLLIGFIGLGLSLMLLKWIVVGTVRDYVPTDLVDANRIGQDPIFLSKPSGIPKIPDTTTTTIAVTMNGGNPSPRTVTVAKGKPRSTTTTPTNPRGGGGASGSQVTIRNRHPVITTSTSASRSTIGPVTSSPSPSNPTVLHDSTQMWTQEHTTTERVSTTLTTRSTGPRKTPSPTVSIPDEHFETCHEKDLAYCLNDGECFVIETSTGPHKHCKCREGYQGIRCDQFLPKTDSDPMDHLGIEFMESKEVYKRQVLSITSIAMAISLLGTLCMALYCRNKRRREKLQAHLKETRSLKNYASNGLDPKARSSNTSLQLHKYCKRPSQPREGALCESSFAHCNVNNTTTNTCRGPAKHYRSSSLSNSPDQRTRPAHWSAPRRTPPVTRGRLNPIGPSKFSGPAYQHLQEVEPCEKDIEAQGYQMQGQRPSGSDPRQDAFLHMRPAVQSAEGSPLVARWGSPGPVEELTTEQKQQAPSVLRTSLRRPGHSYSSCCAPPPPFRSCSIPIIPSVHCHHHHNDISCMQTSVSPAAAESTSCKEVRRAERSERRGSSSSSSSCLQKRDEVATLLEEAQEQLRALALAHRKREDAAAAVNQGGSGAGAVATATRVEARETVCFLSPHGGGGGGEGGASSGLVTETQLLSPNLSQRDLSQRGQ